MKLLGILLLLAFICFYSVYGERLRKGKSGDAAGRAELRRQLFDDYDPINIPDDVTVQFGMSLLSLDVNEDKGTIDIDAWLKYTWKDSRLSWNNETNGINLLRISPIEIWKPDITLYNSANLKDMMQCWDSNPILFSTGDVLWVPPCQISSHCNFTLDKAPYGQQKCSLKFGSWTYDADMLDIQLYMGSKYADVDYFGSTEWKLVETTAQRNEKFYPCCVEPYPDVTYNLTIQRIDTTWQSCPPNNF